MSEGERTLRQRLLPSPATSLLLALLWPVLNRSWSIGQLLLGVLLALAIPWFTARLHSPSSRARRPLAALRLAAVVLADIVRANLQVARLVLGPQAAMRPGYVWVPLDIESANGIVVLSAMVTMTPGTVSADLSPDRRHLLVHALHLVDESALVADIKARYERPLMEIFQ